MLVRFDPFREFDRLAQQVLGDVPGRNGVMAMDAYRRDGEFVVHFDLPGVAPDSIDVSVEHDVLTVTAERARTRTEGDEVVASERAHGRFSRQLLLGESLDSDRIAAHYEDGVLTVTIPVAEQAKRRRIEITAASRPKELAGATS